MEIETTENEQGHQHLEDPTLLEGMLRMTIWTSTDWEEVESIEHRNLDIIMEDLGVILSGSMKVDMEEAWQG